VFLGALAGEDAALDPAGGRWTNAGCVYGPQRAVAWRVLDAQYFGVAQRRRRVFVVASARDDFDPAAVLFESEGVRRDTAPRREAGERIAPCVTNGPPFSRTGNERVEAEAMVAVRMVAFGEYVEDGTASAMKARDYKDATDLVATAQPIAFSGQMSAPQTDVDLSQTLQAKNPAAVAQPIPIHDQATRHAGKNGEKTMGKGNGLGIGQPGDPMNTLTKGDRHAVAQPIAYALDSLSSNSMKSANPISGCNEVNVSKTLDTSRGLDPSCNQGGIAVAQPIVYERDDQDARLKEVSVAPTFHAKSDNTCDLPVVLHPNTAVAFKYTMGAKAHGIGYADEQSPTLDTKADSNAVLTPAMQVRRLTPVECERLQGFPDGYTNIPWRKKPESPDGPRYKALGNSWAVPVVRWIGKRIQEAVQ
jgi:DNA (cytosine-5)-methyltransferase 1